MKIILKIFIISVALTTLTASSEAQTPLPADNYRDVLNVDSLLWHNKWMVYFLPEVVIAPERQFRSNRQRMRYNRLVRNFLRVYPYVEEISGIYNNIEDTLNMIDDESLRRRYVKLREQQIVEAFKPKIKTMTLSQGILMVKLLDRETGNTAYDIVEELRGTVRAFFWQGFALLFGNNLRTEYDPYGDDKDIETLVLKYHDGYFAEKQGNP